MKRALLPILVLTWLLSACALPMARVTSSSSPTPLYDPIQTQVSELLVQTEVSHLLTQLPATEAARPTETPLPPQPTATAPAPTATNTPVIVTTSLPISTETAAPGTTTQAPEPTDVQAAAVTPEPSPSATQPAGPTSTPSLPDPTTRFGNPTWEDTFENDLNWPVGANKFTDMQVKDRVLTLTGLSTKDGWRLSWPNLADFYLEATMKSGTCSGTDRYGIIARVPDPKLADRGYLVGVTCNGQYSLREWSGNKMTNLVPWTASTVIQAGSNQTNRVGLLAVGNKLSVYINGLLLKEVKDSSFSKGGIGLFVGANTTANYTVTVTDISYWENPKP